MPQNSVLKKNKLYVKIEKDKLQYEVIAPSGNAEKGEISAAELSMGELTTLENLKPLLPAILRITSNRGHTQPDWGFCLQNVGNCVVAAHQVGLRVRLGEDKLFHYFLQCEFEILGKLRKCERDNTLTRFSPKPKGSWFDLSQQTMSENMLQEMKDYYIKRVEQTTEACLTRAFISPRI